MFDGSNIVNAIFIKCFDAIDHNISALKYENEQISPGRINCRFFLFLQTISVNLHPLYVPTLHANGAVPQGAMLGLEAFITMVKDVNARLPIYKYVVSQHHPKSYKRPGNKAITTCFRTNGQKTGNGNDVKPNDNTRYYYLGSKALRISKKVTIDCQELEFVNSIKLVGVCIQSDLK